MSLEHLEQMDICPETKGEKEAKRTKRTKMNITITITRYFALGAICLAIGAALASKAPEENANPNNRTPERFGPDAAARVPPPRFMGCAPTSE